MSLDNLILDELREIMAENFTELCSIWRKLNLVGASAPDGMGGFVTSSTDIQAGNDQRVQIYTNFPCRVTVPRSDRAKSEYVDNLARVTESRALIVFPWNTDIAEGDLISVDFRGRRRDYEVRTIMEHSQSYSLHTNCVEVNLQRPPVM